MIQHLRLLIPVVCFCCLSVPGERGNASPPATSDALYDQAVELLWETLDRGSRSASVQAAESLLELGYDRDRIESTLEKRWQQSSKSLGRAAESDATSKTQIEWPAAQTIDALDEHQLRQEKAKLIAAAHSGGSQAKREAADALAAVGTDSEIEFLQGLLHDSSSDVRIAAASAILRIDRRRKLPFEAIDWIVLAGYGLAMLGIGWYFARRVKTTDDYLLGGRSMRPWAVGLSYFVTLFSTISYLAYPGEMIRHGPMMLSMILSFPLVYLVVGRLLIPFIMRLKVTSAYEILEQRFGLSVRMLGSSIFLLLRLTWMAVIIYATARNVLAPLLRLDESATGWIALGMGLLTIAYTSMGGLRAVVWTDVAQMLILLVGAVLSIVMISASLGDWLSWWPSAWSPEWDPPRLWFDADARVTMASAALSAFVWKVCTAGSDQMAIQRYLATRDARAARGMFGISLVANALITTLLCALGLALFAYFNENPRMLPAGETLRSGADQLLSQFVVRGLPPGVSGLLVAGLLAAAMSSLSSGLSSSCSVITVDWIDRFRRTPLSDSANVKTAKTVSWVVGIAIVGLSILAGLVQGNLLEITFKLVNLLTAPLFVLFFMAMFVPWATVPGTWAAAAASIAVAVLIANYEDLNRAFPAIIAVLEAHPIRILGKQIDLSLLWRSFGLGFLSMMPYSLASGIVVGCLASLLPLGKRRPMLERARSKR